MNHGWTDQNPTTQETRQEAARAEIMIGRIPGSLWSKGAVLEAVKNVSTLALRHLAIDYMKFAGIFASGRQLEEWLWEEIKRRNRQ